jgi:hypothetical protein
LSSFCDSFTDFSVVMMSSGTENLDRECRPFFHPSGPPEGYVPRFILLLWKVFKYDAKVLIVDKELSEHDSSSRPMPSESHKSDKNVLDQRTDSMA